jgi:hypothetical protein
MNHHRLIRELGQSQLYIIAAIRANIKNDEGFFPGTLHAPQDGFIRPHPGPTRRADALSILR